MPGTSQGRVRLATGLLIFVWLLPFHIVVMAWLFGGLGLPGPVVRVVAAWKEGLIAALVTAAALRVVLGRGERSPVQWLDLAVFGLGLLALLYLVGAGYWFGLEVPVGARLYGLRDAVYFSLLYFVGRATPDVVRDERVLKALFLVGVITSVVGVAERLFVTPQMLVALGAAAYFQEFLGATLFTLGNAYGLPNNYETTIGGHMVPRVGSTYLMSQGFAISFLIIVPAATVWLLARRRTALAWLGYALVWTGLLLTITRISIVACLLQALAIAAVRRRWELIVSAAAALTLALGGALVLVPGLAAFAWQTLTWQSSSSLSHLRDWGTGIGNALRYPFGAGLGVADMTAVRFGLDPLAGDNQYLKYAVELGLLGLGLHLATMAGALLAGVKSARHAHDVQADYGLMVATATLGILLNALTAFVFNSMMLTYVFFWLVGSLVTANLADGTGVSGAWTIGIDLFSLVPGVGRGAGFHRYAVELVAALAQLDDAHHYILFVNRHNAQLFPAGGRFTQVVAPLTPAREVWPLRLAWQHLLLPRYARSLGLDVLHSPFDTAPLHLPVPSVVTVMDLIADIFYPTHFPGDVSFAKARYLFHAKRHAARRANVVICPTRASADEVARHYGVRTSSLRVVPLGADHAAAGAVAPSPPGAPAPARPYILSVVSLSPHKNVSGLLEAFRLARERFNLPHELHLVGMPGTGAGRVQRSLAAAAAAGLPVRALGYVDDRTLRAEYEGASLLAFVPFAEGFGLPPLEAMARGVPVVASAINSVAEVCGSAAVLVPPDRASAVAEAIGLVLTDQGLAERLRVAGRARALEFTWEATARATREVYETAAGGGRR